MANMVSFNSILGSVSQFLSELPTFMRERSSKAYNTSAYFVAKNVAELPMLIFIPTVWITAVYFIVGLNTSSIARYLYAVLIAVLTWYAGSGYGLCISTFLSKLEQAMASVPFLVVPFMMFAGFLISQSDIPYYYYEFEYLSTFKYFYQASYLNEFTDLQLTCMDAAIPCNPIAMAGFKESMQTCLVIVGLLGVGLRIIAYIGLEYVSTPKKMKVLT